MIHGLKEYSEKEDLDEIININKAIGNTEFTKYNIIRFGRIGNSYGDKARPLKVEFDSHISKLNVLRNANCLPYNQKYKNLSIQHDLTKKQQQQLNQLKQESRKIEENDTEGKHKYRVRGPPGKWTIVTFPKN